MKVVERHLSATFAMKDSPIAPFAASGQRRKILEGTVLFNFDAIRPIVPVAPSLRSLQSSAKHSDAILLFLKAKEIVETTFVHAMVYLILQQVSNAGNFPEQTIHGRNIAQKGALAIDAASR